MNKQHQYILSFFLIIGFITIACEGPEGPMGPQGQQGPQGEQGPQGTPGEDGTANATVHIFDVHDFSSSLATDLCLGENISHPEMIESSWNVYLGRDNGDFDLIYWHIPGLGNFGASEYDAVTAYDFPGTICLSEQPLIEIRRRSGPGEEYDEIRIVQIVASNVIDHRGKQEVARSPEIPDVSNYYALVDYFGNNVQIVMH